MATSGAMTTSNSKINYTITITQNSQSITNNTSNVTVSVRFYRTNTAYETYGTGTVYCKINGTTYSASVTPSQKINYSGIVLFKKTLNISHADNGTKTLTCSAWISHEMLTSSEQSYSQTLTTIPRKSTLTLTNGTLGSSNTITVNRKSTSFTHTIKYTCGSYSGTLCTKSTNTSISWVPSLSFSEGAPNGTSVYISVDIETFNGSTSLGTNSYGYNCAIPDTVVPSVSFEVADIKGYSSVYGGYIQGKSKLGVNITASGIYYSKIKTYRTRIVDSNGNTIITNSSSSFETDPIPKDGTISIYVEVVDSRGRSASASTTITVKSYSLPKIMSFTLKRCDSDGSLNSSGAYLIATFTASATDLDGLNTATYKLKYKKSSDSTYTEETLSGYQNNFSPYDGTYIFEADTAYSYDAILTVQDNFSTSTPFSAKGSSIKKLFSFLRKGLGIALGKVAEIENAFEVDFDIYANKDIYDKNRKIITNGLAVYTGSGTDYGIDPDTTLDTLILTDVNTPTGYFMYIHTMFYSSKSTTSARAQIAIPYQYAHATYYRYFYDGLWSEWYKHMKSTDIVPKLLWSGSYYMNASQTVYLGQKVSEQNTGIVLVFSAYDNTNGIADNSGFSTHFVSKYEVSQHEGCGHTFNLSGVWVNGCKYLYISDARISGHAKNTNTALVVGGITYDNTKFVLRYVIGV